MIGPKKLSTIRQELERALSAGGKDPIHWLDELMNASEYQGSSGESEILRWLKRFLDRTEKQHQEGCAQ